MSDGDKLAPGYRFYPTEEELISFYLQQKLQGRRQEDFDGVIPVLYIYDYNPWDLPQLAGEQCRSDPQLEEWFFFIPRQEREARGARPNRLTTTGYWKATGSPGWVYSSSDHRIIGVKRTMVFYHGRSRTQSGPSKTDWKMNEYMAIHPASQPSLCEKGEFTICRVYKKSKCLRSFDRRPFAPPLPPIARPTSSHPSSSSSNHQNQRRSTVEGFSSGEGSSSSGNRANNHNIGPSQGSSDHLENNMDYEIDKEPLWDLDQLMWSI